MSFRANTTSVQPNLLAIGVEMTLRYTRHEARRRRRLAVLLQYGNSDEMLAFPNGLGHSRTAGIVW